MILKLSKCNEKKDLFVPDRETFSVTSRLCRSTSDESTTPPNHVYHKHMPRCYYNNVTHTATAVVLSKRWGRREIVAD